MLEKALQLTGRKSFLRSIRPYVEYEDVLREKPDCVEAYLRLACAHAEKGPLDAAIENMKKVLSVEPDRLEAHVYLGCFYAKKWMLDEAVKELGEAKELRDCILEKLIYRRGKQYPRLQV